MNITLNGKQTEVNDGSTLAELLDLLRIKRERIAVEVNLDIVPKAAHGSHLLNDGDKVEIVQFVGGG